MTSISTEINNGLGTDTFDVLSLYCLYFSMRILAFENIVKNILTTGLVENPWRQVLQINNL